MKTSLLTIVAVLAAVTLAMPSCEALQQTEAPPNSKAPDKEEIIQLFNRGADPYSEDKHCIHYGTALGKDLGPRNQKPEAERLYGVIHVGKRKREKNLGGGTLIVYL